jgi:hypothetical protein
MPHQTKPSQPIHQKSSSSSSRLQMTFPHLHTRTVHTKNHAMPCTFARTCANTHVPSTQGHDAIVEPLLFGRVHPREACHHIVEERTAGTAARRPISLWHGSFALRLLSSSVFVVAVVDIGRMAVAREFFVAVLKQASTASQSAVGAPPNNEQEIRWRTNKPKTKRAVVASRSVRALSFFFFRGCCCWW